MSVLDAEQPFNMRQWALDHERRDDERFAAINKILAAAALALVALLGWSLKAQYDTMAKQVEAANVQLAAIRQVSAEVAEVKAVSKSVE